MSTTDVTIDKQRNATRNAYGLSLQMLCVATLVLGFAWLFSGTITWIACGTVAFFFAVAALAILNTHFEYIEEGTVVRYNENWDRGNRSHNATIRGTTASGKTKEVVIQVDHFAFEKFKWGEWNWYSQATRVGELRETIPTDKSPGEEK